MAEAGVGVVVAEAEAEAEGDEMDGSLPPLRCMTVSTIALPILLHYQVFKRPISGHMSRLLIC